jgi:hypothetical protein
MKNISLPVWICVALQQVIAYTWYSNLLFGKAWFSQSGSFVEPYGFTLAFFMMSITASLLMTRMMAWLFPKIGIVTVGKGLLVGALLWTAFAGPVLAVHELGMGLTWQAILIDTSKELVAFMLTGAILTAWKPKTA